MRGASEWPLPSESRRVSAYFYLADGLAVGGGVTVLLALVVSSLLLWSRGQLDGSVAGGGVILAFAFAYTYAKLAAAFGEARRTSPDDPPEAKDWKRTRVRTTLGAVTLLLAGGSVALAAVLAALFRTFLLPVVLPFAMIVLGLGLRLYGFHRLGMRVL